MNPTASQKTTYLALCLLPCAKNLAFSFLLKLMLCGTVFMFSRGEKRGDLKLTTQLTASSLCHFEGPCPL